MKKRIIQKIFLCLCLIIIIGANIVTAAEDYVTGWVRTGDLGPKPKRITSDFPLSDQTNQRKWEKYKLKM